LGHDALDDLGDDPADREDDEEAEQLRQEAEERVEPGLYRVADVHCGDEHGGTSLLQGTSDSGPVGGGRHQRRSTSGPRELLRHLPSQSAVAAERSRTLTVAVVTLRWRMR